MIKGLVLAVLLVAWAAFGKTQTVKSIVALFIGGLGSLLIAWQLAVVTKNNFTDLLKFQIDWLYGEMAVGTGYALLTAASVAWVRYILSRFSQPPK